MGLNNESYSTIRSQILALDPFPPLDKIFNMTQQEKSHKKVMIGHNNQNDLAMEFTMKEPVCMVEKGACRICGRHGHEEVVCYEVIGYVAGWGSRGRGRRSQGGRNDRGGRSNGNWAGRGYNQGISLVAIHTEATIGSFNNRPSSS